MLPQVLVIMIMTYDLKYIEIIFADYCMLVLKQVLGSRGDMETKIDAQTKIKLKELDTNMSQNKEVALKRLLDIVLDIKPELHENWKK